MNNDQTPVDDNDSIHSDDSNVSVLTQREKLENLINMDLKHSTVYYDLRSKNNLLKLDLENLCNSCQRFENQKKKKSERSEEMYEKLIECQESNKMRLKEKLLSIAQNLEKTNNLFCEAFENYNSDVLKDSIDGLDKETEKTERKLLEYEEQLHNLQLEGKITESLMKSKKPNNIISSIESAINMLFEYSMKRPEIGLEETCLKLENEIKNLEKKKVEI